MSREDLTGQRVTFPITNLTTMIGMMKCFTQHVTKKKTKENLDALTAALTPPPADDHRKKAVVQYGSSCRTGD